MIRTSQVHHCRACGSTHIVKNGRNRSGRQQYQCRACGASKVLLPKQRYSEERKAEVLRAYQERSSLRGLNRTFGITRKTITQWLKKLLRQRVGCFVRETFSFSNRTYAKNWGCF